MAQKTKKYQCLVCNKLHDTEEDARNCHNGPIQGIEQGFDEYKKSFVGAH
jgi:molybdopterin-guanine dinucleotide biosynthesis protein A